MEQFAYDISAHLRQRALALPETTEGTSCVNRAFKVRNKNFLFIGEKDDQVRVMLRLKDSLDDALALQDPRIEIGKLGWVTMKFAPSDPPDPELLSAWVVESFRTLGPKSLVKQFDVGR